MACSERGDVSQERSVTLSNIIVILLILFAGASLLVPSSALAVDISHASLRTGQLKQGKSAAESDSLRMPHAGDRLLVKFRDKATGAGKMSAHSSINAKKLKEFKTVRNLHLVKLPDGLSVKDAIELYRTNKDVLYAEPDYVVKTPKIPADPRFEAQWGLYNTGQSGGTPGADIGALAAWDITTGSKNVVVAVVDTGIDYNHTVYKPDLEHFMDDYRARRKYGN